MKRELATSLPYDKVDFKWICKHYDVHLKGSCMLNGSLHEFENTYPGEDENMIVKIYKLNLMGKLKWRWRQWLFEKCVGYHWSYPQRKLGQKFYYRKPKWLYVQLCNLYYFLT